ncbi:MAG: T9SS type A sorting domain-containing protein, partial [Bacteroidia bacterium]|nr:T9SS type A sorting domain-containing protein [Bacteroidia bacterium]
RYPIASQMKKIYFVVLLVGFLSSVKSQTLTGIDPDTAFAGQHYLQTTITGTDLYAVTITPVVDIVYEVKLKKGNDVIQIYHHIYMNWASISLTQISSVLAIPVNAGIGVYDLELITGHPFIWYPLTSFTLPAAFTIVPPDGLISGKLYFDENENGIRDGGEKGLFNQSISLMPTYNSEQTDSSGDYLFGVRNGTYNVAPYFYNSYDHHYVISSDSASYTVVINNSSSDSLEFGAKDALESVTPSSVFRGQHVSSIVVSHVPFLPGSNPWGNVRYDAYISLVNNPTIKYSIPLSAFQILDSSHTEMNFQVPVGAITGMYDLVINIDYKVCFLRNAFTVSAAQSYLGGHCYLDMNTNGSFDTGEPPIQNVRLRLNPDSSYAFSDPSGNYLFGAVFGSHILSCDSLNLTSGLALVSLPSYSFTNTTNQSGFDFGFRSTLPDYTCNLNFTPGFMRCLMPVKSDITYSNRSNVESQGQVYLVHSPNLTFHSSSPAFSSQNGDTIFWDFTNLQPLEVRSISVIYNIPGSGTLDFNTGIRVSDNFGVVQYQNASSFSTPVRCSFDPNDKLVLPVGVDETMHYTHFSDTLDYTIRFQNTGNDTAYNVFIVDTLDISLDVQTMEIVAASHPMHVQIDNGRIIKFSFDNIMLADSFVDETNSHGFVRYRIRPVANLPDPTRIENSAYIYFDFNSPVVTNTTWNTMVSNIYVGMSESIEIDNDVRFYPNPMGEKGYFSIVNPKASWLKLDVYDIKGAVVTSIETKGDLIELNRKELSPGIYFFRLVNTESGKTHTGKISLR